MDIRYCANQRDVKRYTTEELRDEFLISNLYVPDTVVAVYSHVDRMVTLGCMPVEETVSIEKGIDCWKNFGTDYFLERREIGIFNIGGDGVITADGVEYRLGYKDCLYITKGTREVFFKSCEKERPAKFYMVSAPAHTAYETKLLTIKDAVKRQLGDEASSNRRVLNQFIHPDVLKTCQLSMGMTALEPGKRLEQHALSHPRAAHGDLHVFRGAGKPGGHAFHGRADPDQTSGDEKRGGGDQPVLEHPLRSRNQQLYVYLGNGRGKPSV